MLQFLSDKGSRVSDVSQQKIGSTFAGLTNVKAQHFSRFTIIMIAAARMARDILNDATVFGLMTRRAQKSDGRCVIYCHREVRSWTMKLSKIFHVISVMLGLIGASMWFLLIFGWFMSATWFAATNDLTLMIGCTIFSFLSAIWLQVATIHHMVLERRGEFI